MAKKTPNKLEAHIALCYIRQSMTRDENDTNSPERQRANIQAFCESKGWLPEWYEDTGGHKSGRTEKGRPAWLSLKKRLGNPDVVALVANDLSRLHRKGWRVGDLIDKLNNYGVALALAAPGRQQIDTSTQQGRMLVQLGAMFDEYYAEDISQRAKDSVIYRKAQGITIGRPPFGTLRNEEGWLIPSDEGAWLLADGKFIAGKVDKPPVKNAIWRSYYDTAHEILKVYVTGKYGIEKLAYYMNDNAYAFRDRKGQPRRVSRDDVRRVVANWAEYGGIVRDKKAKDRPGYSIENVEDMAFDEERAVFPIELLRQVAQTRQARSMKPPDRGAKRAVKFYPLSIITRCAHCERLAEEKNDIKLRSSFNGYTTGTGVRRYRHRRGILCGCETRSVVADELEQDFERLLGLLEVTPEAIELMTELAHQSQNSTSDTQEDFEKEQLEAIALCKRRIDAAVVLFGDGHIDHAEYRRRLENNEREIQYWQTRSTEAKTLTLQLTASMETVQRLMKIWQYGDDEDKQGLVRNFFDYLVYDFDTKQITDFRLKSWAEPFLVLRAALYQQQELETKNAQESDVEEVEYHMPHTGLEPVFLP